jgi:hypothetical protein
MDVTTIVVVILACIVVAAFLVYRSRVRKIRGKLNVSRERF